ncbi:MAG: tRNA pseudouridine(38-40) synthase TruA [Candidatus Eiseniibacteriota bacterium]
MPVERRVATFRLAVEYDGTDFHGWQVQRQHRSVQGDLETALARLAGEPVRIAGAGRTDAGCHAAGQVASVTIPTRLTTEGLRRALNATLPYDVRIVEAAEVGASFHARFNAMRRGYRYRVHARPTALLRRYAWVRDVKATVASLNAASRALLGAHDFTTFSTKGSEGGGLRCRVTRARWSRRSHGLAFDIEADRFLYTMVRRIVATVIVAAERGEGAGAIRAALSAADRRAAAPPAPAHGLCLMRVRYPRVGWIPKEPMDVLA